MAGIGFVLQRVIKRGGIASVFKVALAGTVIVAGPWLLSIVGIIVVNRVVLALAASSLMSFGASLDKFMGVLIYSYAFSLFLFGGVHFIFTRQVADFIYEKKKEKAASSLLSFMILVTVVSLVISVIALQFIDASTVAFPLLFQSGAVLLFVSVNVIWLLMIFASLLRRYFLIFIIYFAGMLISVLCVILFGTHYGEAGVLFGFSLGQFTIVALLYFISLLEYMPNGVEFRTILRYLSKFKFLLIAGVFYYWGMWIDKIVFWFTLGSPIPLTFFRTFEIYDIPVYLANLTIIPGLVYFMITSETDFYQHLVEFLGRAYRNSLSKILEKKYDLLRSIRRALREQSIFQGVETIVLVIVAPALSELLFSGMLSIPILRLTLAAVFFHLLFLTILLFLFYFQNFVQAAIASFIFFFVNLSGSLATSLSGYIELSGLSYLAAGAFGSIAGAVFLFSTARHYEQFLYFQAGKIEHKKSDESDQELAGEDEAQ